MTAQGPTRFDSTNPQATIPIRSAIARALLMPVLDRLAQGRITLVLPNGMMVSSRPVRPGPEAVLELKSWRALRRLLTGGDVAFARSYGDGEWASPDLVALIALAASNDEALRRALSGLPFARFLNGLRHRLRPNTRAGSRRNIVAHYDLGNAFYGRWLDAGMTYSSGLFRSGLETLEEAQEAKQDAILQALELRGGERVLEIGCGWGGLAERLARQGCRVTAITLSPAQLAHARSRIAAAGLADRVELRLQDYRDVAGSFDRIVSVEMIEAVGQAYWPAFFGCLRARLAPDGLAVLQAITVPDDRFAFYASSPDFIQSDIFPGGMLPSPAHLAGGHPGLGCERLLRFGASYALTLAEWRRRFARAWPIIAADGRFDERFRRIWDYYLAYCEAGFRTGATDVALYKLRPVTGRPRPVLGTAIALA